MSAKSKTDTMPSKADLLREELGKHEAEATRRRQALAELDRQARQEQADRERAFDEQVYAAGFDHAEHDAKIKAAREHLHQVVAEHPLTVAMADYLAAQAHKREAFDEYISAMGRLGHPIEGAQHPTGGAVNPLQDLVGRSAENIAERELADRRARFHARRTGTENS